MEKKEQFFPYLPVEQLWRQLIAVACQHTGHERLKVIGLLMELINMQGTGKEGEEERRKKMELSALKPLWQLYTTVIKEYGEGGGREGGRGCLKRGKGRREGKGGKEKKQG